MYKAVDVFVHYFPQSLYEFNQLMPGVKEMTLKKWQEVCTALAGVEVDGAPSFGDELMVLQRIVNGVHHKPPTHSVVVVSPVSLTK